MHDLPTDGVALLALVFLLGLRHGLDADHLAAIDGLTRVAARQHRPHAGRCGLLFSLGHGAVVMAIAAVVGAFGARGVPPAWFEMLGGGVSIAVLTLIGVANLLALWRAPADATVPLVGVRGRAVQALLGRVGAPRGALPVAGIGALFALSFDTLSQAALFAAFAVRHGGLALAVTLGAVFTAGMLVSDGLNGWWIRRLIGRTDRMAVAASRAMTFAVAGTSLLVAAFGAARLLSPTLATWAGGRELALGGSVIGLMATAYLVSCRLDMARVRGA